MSSELVKQYMAEHEQNLVTARVLQENASRNKTDLTEAELDTIEKIKARNAVIKRQLDVIGDSMELDEATRERLSWAGAAQAPATPKYRSAGYLMWDLVHAKWGSENDNDDREAKHRYETYMKRAAQHMGTDASLTVATAGGFGGLWPNPVVGPIIDIYPKGQPFLTAIGKQEAPNSLTFLRPKITDNDWDTGASTQGLQKQEMLSKKFDISTDTLNMVTVGGYLNISQQLLSLHPTAWDIILRQLQGRVARREELAAIAELQLSTGSVTLASGADAATTWAALVNAAAAVAAATNSPPTWMAYGPSGWSRLAKVVDTTGRPVFANLGPNNAFGGGVNFGNQEIGVTGLQQIFTTAITNSYIWMGNEFSFEAYAYPFPVLESIEPSVFGRQVAVAEAVTFYRPVANSAIKVGP